MRTWRKPKGGKGVVYLSHIPHGFYEDQIKGFFEQFGKLTAVSVPRSKTGRARGYAFVEFQHPEVAKIAAETMNNYLMLNRLMKAKYIPPEEQKPKFFVTAQMAKQNHNTAKDKSELQIKHNRKVKNRHLKINLERKLALKLLKKNKMLKSKLTKLGLDYDFNVEKGDIESVIKKKEEHLANKEENKLVTLSNSDELSSEKLNELCSSEETELRETNMSIPVTKENSQKNELKQKTGKKSMDYLQNSTKVQKTLNKNATKSPKQSKLLTSGQKQNNSSKTSKDKSFTKITDSEDVVMEVDENDEEISFKTPPNVLKKPINRQESGGSNVTPKIKKKSILKVTPTESSPSLSKHLLKKKNTLKTT